MKSSIKGKRVILRKLRITDADDVFSYAKSAAVARYTQNMPHPYKRKDAVWYIKNCQKQWKSKKAYCYGIEYEHKIIGSLGLTIKNEGVAELGFAIGLKYWGKGITTEAAKLILKEGFSKLKLHKICATHHPKKPCKWKGDAKNRDEI